MHTVVDIAGGFNILIPTGSEILRFDMPRKISFRKFKGQGVEVIAGDTEQGSIEIAVSPSNFSLFSPPENLEESFKNIFHYYFCQTVKEKIFGDETCQMDVIVPLTFSFHFENLLLGAVREESDFQIRVYRDVEVYAGYYLNESRDVPEIKKYAADENGAHIYGVVVTAETPYITLFNYEEEKNPELIDFMVVSSPTDLFNNFKLMAKKHSSSQSRVFMFCIGDLAKFSEQFMEGEQLKPVEIEVGKRQKILVRLIRKRNLSDEPRVKGIEFLQGKAKCNPVYKFNLFSGETKVVLDRNYTIDIDFGNQPPSTFFIDLFLGPHKNSLILLRRIFVKTGALQDKRIDLYYRFQRVDNKLKIFLRYKKYIDYEEVIPLREAYQVEDEPHKIIKEV